MTSDNHISLQKLEVFCCVVERGGIHRAAEALFVSQPVISGHIRSLQERIGTVLFQRAGRNIALTESGETVYRWASEVLRTRGDLDKELHDLSQGMAGMVSIGSSITVGNTALTPALIDFRRSVPSARIRLEITPVESALDGVRDGRHDFAVVATDHVDDPATLEARLVHHPRWAVVTAATDQVTPTSVRPAELANLPFVCPPSGMAIRRSQDAALASIGIEHRRVEIELGSAESIKQGVIAGLGIALLWRSSVEAELSSGLLREIEVQAQPLRDKLFIVQRKGRRLSPLQTKALDFVESALDRLYAGDSDLPHADDVGLLVPVRAD